MFQKIIDSQYRRPSGLLGRWIGRKMMEQHLPENIRIIGVGGIMAPEDALEKLRAGADLVQLYTGFIYEGPSLVKRINSLILKS